MRKLILIALALTCLTASVPAGASYRSRHEAVATARDYLASQAFSKHGLAEQLRFEGYSRADSNYGATHAGANWYVQAYKSAREYLSGQHFSRSGLISQLEFEGFTHGQAVYGVNRAYR